MFRVIVHIGEKPWPSAGASVVVAPVGACGVDGVGGEDFAGGLVGDGDGGVVGEDQDGCSGVVDADAEVVHAACAAEAELAEAVDAVVSDAPVALVAVVGRGGFDGGVVGGLRGAAAEGAVGPVVVVVVPEAVELVLQGGEVVRGWLGGEPALEGLVEPLDLPLRLRVEGAAVALLDAEACEELLEAVAGAGDAGGEDAAVVGQGRGGGAVGGDGGGEGLDDGGAGDGLMSGAGQQQPGVVVEPVEDLDVGAVGEAPVGEVGLPELVRLVRLEADYRGRGRS